MRLLIVTDSHLAPSAPVCNQNWRAVREYAARSSAQLTVHLGDITLDAVSDETQLETARAMCNEWPTPFRFIPGNHDIGDNPPGLEFPAKHPLQPRLMDSFRRTFGPDYWAMSADNWFLFGLDAQLFGSNLTFETEQWRWLEERVPEAGAGPVAILLHKPLFQNTCEDSAPHIRYVPIEPRRRLINLIARMNVRLVVSGHTHQYMDRTIEGIRHIWLPSTAFFIPDTDQDRVGEKITGLGSLELNGDTYRFDLVCPEGVARNNFVDQPFYRHLK
jgi:predicted phosphodiesterase